MITLQTLRWDNCFSYGSGNELRLDDNTVTQIIGTNGMGKSSIPLIIEEALVVIRLQILTEAFKKLLVLTLKPSPS